MHFNCFICHKQGNFWQDLERICITKCGHIFHLNCLMTHISSQSKSIIQCPVTICSKKIKQANIIQVDLTAVENENNYQINQPIGCSLCNDPLTDSKNLSIAKCGHLYHFICLATLVKPKSNACLVSACRIKLTQAAVTQIHFLHCDVTPTGTMTTDDLRVLLEDKEPKGIVPAVRASLNQATPKKVETSLNQITPKRVVVKQEAIPAVMDQLPPLLQDNKGLCGQKNDQINQQIKNDLERESLMNILDVDKDRNVMQNPEIVKLKQRYKELEEEIEVLKKERNDAKKETAIWEMCFKRLQENFDGTEMMIPNERTLEVMKENEQLKIKARECEREKNDAKKETAIWEMCFKFLQENFEGSEMMIPNERTLEFMKENEQLKIMKHEMEKELVCVKKDVNMNNSGYLKANFDNLTEENLILKSENEAMASDLKKLKEEIKYLNPTIDLVSELVKKHSLENDTLKELNNELLNENTRLASLNETLQKQHDDLKEMNESLQSKNFELTKLNKDYQETNKSLQTENKNQPKSIEPHIGSFILKELINIRCSLSNGNQGTSKRTFSEINNTAIEIQSDDISEEMLKYELQNEELLKQGAENKDVTKQEVENEELLIHEVESEKVLTKKVENEKVKTQERENEEVLTLEMENEEVENEELLIRDVESEKVLTKEVENEKVITLERENGEILTLELENEEVIKQEVENEEVLIRDVESEKILTNEVENEKVITQERENGEVLNLKLENEEAITKQVENELVIMQKVENEEILRKELESEEPEIKRMKLVFDYETEDVPSISVSPTEPSL